MPLDTCESHGGAERDVVLEQLILQDNTYPNLSAYIVYYTTDDLTIG